MNINPNEELEIDLSEIMQSIVKNKTHIILCVLIGIAIGGIYAYTSPKVYKLTTVITPPRNADNRAIVSPQELSDFINSAAWIPTCFEKLHLDEKEWAGLSKNLTAEVIDEENSQYVYMYFYCKQDKISIAKNIISELISLLNSQYSRDIKPIEDNIQTAIAEQKLSIASIENKKHRLNFEISTLKENIRNVEDVSSCKIKLLEDRKQFTMKQIERLLEKQKILESYRKEISSYSVLLNEIISYFQSSLHCSATQPCKLTGGINASLPFIMISDKSNIYENLLNSILELDNVHKRIINMRYDIADINKEIARIKADRDLHLQELQANVEKELLKRDKDLAIQLQTAQLNINKLQNKLDVVSSVKVIVLPSYINKPVKPKKRVILAIAFVLSLFVGVSWAIIRK